MYSSFGNLMVKKTLDSFICDILNPCNIWGSFQCCTCAVNLACKIFLSNYMCIKGHKA